MVDPATLQPWQRGDTGATGRLDSLATWNWMARAQMARRISSFAPLLVCLPVEPELQRRNPGVSRRPYEMAGC